MCPRKPRCKILLRKCALLGYLREKCKYLADELEATRDTLKATKVSLKSQLRDALQVKESSLKATEKVMNELNSLQNGKIRLELK